MGKGTDKLYITHSEWASEDAYSASVGAGASSKAKAAGASFRRLPFHFCALSLQPFQHPVCTSTGTIFELTNILPWIKKHGTNPVDGSPLKTSELIKLHVHKNEEGEYIDPVTFKVLTDNTHIVAIRTTGNVFAYETVERLNIRAKMWRDLVTDEEFSRKDLITLQDPLNVAGRDLSSFQYLKEGGEGLEGQKKVEAVNASALGSSAKILKATEAVAKARKERADPNRNPALLAGNKAGGTGNHNGMLVARSGGNGPSSSSSTARLIPYNAAQHTTGKAAASFTSTGLTPHTSGERALLTEEEYMLKPRRVKNKGYSRIQTNKGDLNIELQTEYAPKAVWNFVQLAKKGYYRGVKFHRNIRNFMIQGGDPTGTGKGGTSIWNRNFADEFDGPLTHDSRGVMSMANKGKNTNSSQFFITYRPTKHLDKKHTIFGKVIDDTSTETLSRLESTPVDSSDRPTKDIFIEDVMVYVDPFEEFQKEQKQKVDAEKEEEEIQKMGGREDERMTWTGKRVRADGNGNISGGGSGSGGGGGSEGVGKYLKTNLVGVGNTSTMMKPRKTDGNEDDEVVEEIPWDVAEPVSKKAKVGHAGGGFGNFDNW